MASRKRPLPRNGQADLPSKAVAIFFDIGQVPAEIWLSIELWLDLRSLCALWSTCKELRQHRQTVEIWRALLLRWFDMPITANYIALPELVAVASICEAHSSVSVEATECSPTRLRELLLPAEAVWVRGINSVPAERSPALDSFLSMLGRHEVGFALELEKFRHGSVTLYFVLIEVRHGQSYTDETSTLYVVEGTVENVHGAGATSYRVRSKLEFNPGILEISVSPFKDFAVVYGDHNRTMLLKFPDLEPVPLNFSTGSEESSFLIDFQGPIATLCEVLRVSPGTKRGFHQVRVVLIDGSNADQPILRRHTLEVRNHEDDLESHMAVSDALWGSRFALALRSESWGDDPNPVYLLQPSRRDGVLRCGSYVLDHKERPVSFFGPFLVFPNICDAGCIDVDMYDDASVGPLLSFKVHFPSEQWPTSMRVVPADKLSGGLATMKIIIGTGDNDECFYECTIRFPVVSV